MNGLPLELNLVYKFIAYLKGLVFHIVKKTYLKEKNLFENIFFKIILK